MKDNMMTPDPLPQSDGENIPDSITEQKDMCQFGYYKYKHIGTIISHYIELYSNILSDNFIKI